MAFLKIRRKGEPKFKDVYEKATFLPVAKDQLGISDQAAMAILDLLKAKENNNLLLRVAIRGGGCSGFSIHYEFTDAIRDNDLVFSKNIVRVIIDKKSLSLLGGATLHCRDYLGSSSFVLVNNPIGKQCSCGQSFSL